MPEIGGHFAYDSEESITAQNGIRRRSIQGVLVCCLHLCLESWTGYGAGRRAGVERQGGKTRWQPSFIALGRLGLRSDTCECAGGDILRLRSIVMYFFLTSVH